MKERHKKDGRRPHHEPPSIRDIREPGGIEDVSGPLQITSAVTIPSSELHWKFSQPLGPGARPTPVESRVELIFDPATSSVLNLDQCLAIYNHLSRKMTRAGKLRLVSDEHRSQLENRQVALKRLRALLRAALEPRRIRVPIAVPMEEREERIHEKHLESEKNRARRFEGLEAAGEI